LREEAVEVLRTLMRKASDPPFHEPTGLARATHDRDAWTDPATYCTTSAYISADKVVSSATMALTGPLVRDAGVEEDGGCLTALHSAVQAGALGADSRFAATLVDSHGRRMRAAPEQALLALAVVLGPSIRSTVQSEGLGIGPLPAPASGQLPLEGPFRSPPPAEDAPGFSILGAAPGSGKSFVAVLAALELLDRPTWERVSAAFRSWNSQPTNGDPGPLDGERRKPGVVGCSITVARLAVFSVTGVTQPQWARLLRNTTAGLEVEVMDDAGFLRLCAALEKALGRKPSDPEARVRAASSMLSAPRVAVVSPATLKTYFKKYAVVFGLLLLVMDEVIEMMRELPSAKTWSPAERCLPSIYRTLAMSASFDSVFDTAWMNWANNPPELALKWYGNFLRSMLLGGRLALCRGGGDTPPSLQPSLRRYYCSLLPPELQLRLSDKIRLDLKLFTVETAPAQLPRAKLVEELHRVLLQAWRDVFGQRLMEGATLRFDPPGDDTTTVAEFAQSVIALVFVEGPTVRRTSDDTWLPASRYCLIHRLDNAVHHLSAAVRRAFGAEGRPARERLLTSMMALNGRVGEDEFDRLSYGIDSFGREAMEHMYLLDVVGESPFAVCKTEMLSDHDTPTNCVACRRRQPRRADMVACASTGHFRCRGCVEKPCVVPSDERQLDLASLGGVLTQAAAVEWFFAHCAAEGCRKLLLAGSRAGGVELPSTVALPCGQALAVRAIPNMEAWNAAPSSGGLSMSVMRMGEAAQVGVDVTDGRFMLCVGDPEDPKQTFGRAIRGSSGERKPATIMRVLRHGECSAQAKKAAAAAARRRGAEAAAGATPAEGAENFVDAALRISKGPVASQALSLHDEGGDRIFWRVPSRCSVSFLLRGFAFPIACACVSVDGSGDCVQFNLVLRRGDPMVPDSVAGLRVLRTAKGAVASWEKTAADSNGADAVRIRAEWDEVRLEGGELLPAEAASVEAAWESS